MPRRSGVIVAQARGGVTLRKLALAIMAFATVSCVSVGDMPASAVQPGSRYVALGSSFAAGPGLGSYRPGTPPRCTRALGNYPSLVSERMNLVLDDRTCSGATVANILGPWGELPAQIDAVDGATRLVTVTVGGNDLDYVGNLVMSGCEPGSSVSFAGRSFPCTKPVAPAEETYATLERNLTKLADEVAQRAPEARLVFVQYLTLLPQEMCAQTQMSDANAALAQETATRLAAITDRVAAATGATVIKADKLSRDHTACDAEPWSQGNVPSALPGGAVPWHPNAAGHTAIAQALAMKLGWTD
ncbi:SGNH/GDSL hydrolase family protein [Erythrobacter sp. 3-20A1M]|nr:SGNH/GDSL hydrolase family protein [Erythrobacter sp. 3-20A1M]